VNRDMAGWILVAIIVAIFVVLWRSATDFRRKP
jgi:hypothetical protein